LPSEHAVANASPLITLFKSGQADILPGLFRDIVVPSAVWIEVMNGPASDAAAQQLPSIPWITRIESVDVPARIQAWDLGAVESEVLAYAAQHSTHLAIVDDGAARRCARTLGIGVIGTLGLVVLAKR